MNKLKIPMETKSPFILHIKILTKVLDKAMDVVKRPAINNNILASRVS
ncbi:hypothetical protein [Natronospora cellulosivora (SeqCode)]